MRHDRSREERKLLHRQRRQHRRDQMKFKRSGSVLAGLVILGVGTVFLLKQFDFAFPAWLFTWPMILVIFGLFAGASNSFRDAGWLLFSGVGVVFLMRNIWPNIPVWNYTWPVIIIVIGLMMILSPRGKKRFWTYEYKFRVEDPAKTTGITNDETIIDDPLEPEKRSYPKDINEDNWLDVVSVFGNIKKQVYAKDFKGGDIVSVFGGAEINLMHTDFNGTIHIEMVQIFGGAKLIVPPHWQIHSQMAAIFGGIEDKRTPQANYDPNKVVILNGTTLFGGIEIRSY
jgi:predicted membrane protein